MFQGSKTGCLKSSTNANLCTCLQPSWRTAARSKMMPRSVLSRCALLAQQVPLECALSSMRGMSSVTIPPPACMLRPLEAPFRYLFGPGPSNVPPRILAAGGRPIIGHMHSEMFGVLLTLYPYALFNSDVQMRYFTVKAGNFCFKHEWRKIVIYICTHFIVDYGWHQEGNPVRLSDQ